MQNLSRLISLLSEKRKIHISILDILGVLADPLTQISFENVIHSKEICSIAKSTEKGLNLCLYCKGLANEKAIKGGVPFYGHCIYGICEAAVPVTVRGSVAAVVYVGNAVLDREKSEKRIRKSSKISGVEAQKLICALDDCEAIGSPDELYSVGEIVADYLKMLLEKAPPKNEGNSWLFLAVKRHADEDYLSSPTLKELAAIYHKNEKYLGRLFKRKSGSSFSSYCLDKRLERAKELLLQTEEKIIDIALECGFNSISYFNRTFKEKYGISPSEARK